MIIAFLRGLLPFKSSTLIVLHMCLLVQITESGAYTCI